MKFLFLTLILVIFSSCQARDFKAEINRAFDNNNTIQIEKLLNEYYQINGTDETLEISYVKLAILKKDLQKILDIYKNTKYISVKKNKELLNDISKIIIEQNKKISIDKRIVFYKNSLKVFPYAEKIYDEYLLTLLMLKKTDEAFKVYLRYDEVFNKTNKYLDKILFFKLKDMYEAKTDIRALRLIAKLKIKNATLFLENKIKNNPKIIIQLGPLPKGFNMNIIKKLINSEHSLVKRIAISLFIKYAQIDDVKKIINKLYSKIVNPRLKIFIYLQYYNRFNKEIDDKLILKLLNNENPQAVKAAIGVIRDLKLYKYKDNLKSILGSAKKFKCSEDMNVLKALFVIDKEYAKTFILNVKEVDKKDLIKVLKRKEALISLGETVECKICLDILQKEDFDFKDFKNSEEELKAKSLKLMLLHKENLSFFNDFDNIVYYNVFSVNTEYLNKSLLEKVAFAGYKNWKDSKMLVNYLNKLSVNEINKYFSMKKIKDIKDKYFMKLLYYSVILKKTNEKNDEFERFILEKGFFKAKYINLFKFNENHIKILIKLYLVEHRVKIKIKIIEKIIEILNK